MAKSIKDTQKQLKDGSTTCVAQVDYYLNRINKFDKNLNSFLTTIEDPAYEKAKEMDKVLKDDSNAFKQFPLLGVVIALKDLYLTKGIKTTAGSKVLEDYIPQYSATVVERLEKAGAIIIGKTNCDAWAHGASGENSDFGPTRNPWDTTRVPGGSSSGSAVAVASDFAVAAMGTDTGGSIRQPASFTNTVGFKPTYGAVSRYGVVAMASSLDCMGHFTHTVEDSELIFNVTKGEDKKDSTVVPNPDIVSKKENYVLGVPKEYEEGLDPKVKEAVEKAKKELGAKGVEFKEVSLPHTKYGISVYYIVQPAEVSSNLNRYDGVRFGNDRSVFGDEAKRRIMLGTYVLSSGYYDAYYDKAMRVRTKIIEDFDTVFQEVDGIFAPVSPTLPFKLGERVEDPLQMYLADVYTVSANLAGIPGLAIPAGFSGNLPVGFQVLGPAFSEEVLFDIGKRFQESTTWHEKEPYLE